MTGTEADAHSYVFRRLDGSAWVQITFMYERGALLPGYFGTYQPTWLAALDYAEKIRNRFIQVERERQENLKRIQQLERDYPDAARGKEDHESG